MKEVILHVFAVVVTAFFVYAYLQYTGANLTENLQKQGFLPPDNSTIEGYPEWKVKLADLSVGLIKKLGRNVVMRLGGPKKRWALERNLFSAMFSINGIITPCKVYDKEDPECVGTEDFTIQSSFQDDVRIPVRLYKPLNGTETCGILYMHGGGWTIGNIQMVDNSIRHLAKHSECRVLSVEYRLAPESPFPAALHDSWDALVWLSNKMNKRVVVAGDSAGGNLAAALSLKDRDEKTGLVAVQVLLYPALQAEDFVSSTYETNKNALLLSPLDMEEFWDNYRNEEFLNALPPASPWTSYFTPPSALSLKSLPPAIVLLCGKDPLNGEGKKYAHSLKDDGVQVQVLEYEDLPHAFMMLTQPPLDLPVALSAWKEVSAALKKALV